MKEYTDAVKRSKEIVDKLSKELTKACDINWNSTQQVGAFLFEKLKLPVLERTAKGKPSTNSENVLPRLKEHHPIVGTLLEYREQIKLQQFLTSWGDLMDKNGRLHPSFKIHGTVTGRLCLREGTPIMVPGGTKPIEQVKEGDLVYSYDNDLKITLKKVKHSGYTGLRECYRVHWIGQGHHTEGYIDATDNHPIRLTDGRYLRVDQLKGGKFIKWRGRYHRGERVLALHRSIYDGRNYLHCTGIKGKLREARVVFESVNNWSPEHIHHQDGNSLNDYPSNLKGLSHSEHCSLHACKDSKEMYRRGVISGGIVKANKISVEIQKDKYERRFSKEQIEQALKDGKGIKKAANILNCGYEALRKRMDDYKIDYDGRKYNNHMITHIEKLPNFYPVYDIEVEGTHNFIANEICVHNSCVDPNFQQVPRDPFIRSLIAAPEGWTFFEADYSQVELRVAAMLSNEKNMKLAYQTGEDLHRKTASATMGIPPEKVTKEDRKKAKAVNFGFLYGMSYRKFKDYARDKYGVNLTEEEAKKFRERFFDLYPDLLTWHERQRRLVAKYKFVRSPLGRKRRLPEVDSPDKAVKAEAERQSINSPVQGFASDLCLFSLIRVKEELPQKDIKIVGLVHDAMLGMVRTEKKEALLPKVKEIMEDMRTVEEIFDTQISVPIEVEIKVGPWGKGVEWK
jgi:DNA polymerase I-like protein with 3'-5' exonuclease and polymerase domains